VEVFIFMLPYSLSVRDLKKKNQRSFLTASPYYYCQPVLPSTPVYTQFLLTLLTSIMALLILPLTLQRLAKCFVFHIDSRPTCYNTGESIIDYYNFLHSITLSLLLTALPSDSKTASVRCDSRNQFTRKCPVY
jgi:hypothetical protein